MRGRVDRMSCGFGWRVVALAGMLAICASLACAGSARAEAQATAPAAAMEELRFRIELHGVTIARLGMNAVMDGDRYALAARMETVGLAARLHPVGYVARVSGIITPDGLRPERYEETARTPRRATETLLVWNDGLPRRLHGEPAAAFEGLPDPEAQEGALDILTGLYLILRSQDAAEACTLEAPLYDGRRPSSVEIADRVVEGNAIRCMGRFLRPETEFHGQADGTDSAVFGFEAIYRATPDGRMQAETIRTGSILGRIVIRRETPDCAAAQPC